MTPSPGPRRHHCVAVVDTEMGRILGGAQTYLLRLLPRLLSRGHHVEVVTEGSPEPRFAALLRESGVCVHSAIWRYPSVPEDAARLLAAWFGQGGFDVFLLSASAAAGWLALPLLSPSVAVVTVAHSDSETFYAPLRHYGPLVTRAGAVSDEIARRLREDVGLPLDRVSQLPYGVPVLTSFEASTRIEARRHTGRLDIVYSGRLAHEQKRVADLVALIKLCRTDPVRFRILGDGPAREWMEAELCEERHMGVVHLEGWLDWKGVRERLRSADVCVLTSDMEGLPIALLEAMGHALVPVASAHPGTSAVIQAEGNGVLVPLGDVHGFRAAIQHLHRDPARRARLALAARDTAARFSEEAMVERYEACFREASADAVSRPRGSGSFSIMPSCRSPYPLWLRRLRTAGARVRMRLAHGRSHGGPAGGLTYREAGARRS